MSHNKTTLCHKCNREIRNNNVKKHIVKCVGPKIKKIRGVDFDPAYGYKNGTRKAWNYGLSKETDDRVAKHAKHLSDTYAPRGAILLTKEKLSELAKKNNFGGYQKNAGRSKKYRVQDPFGNEVVLQSSYELRCFEILTSLDIKWIRPPYLKYGSKKYFADFYLTEHGVYLDPKNNYKAVQDAEKIACVCEENSVKVYVLTEDMLTPEYIKNIVS